MGDRCWSLECGCEFAIEFGSGMEIHFYPNNKGGGALAVSQNTNLVGSASLNSREWLLAQEYVADPNRHTDFFLDVRERVLRDEGPKELSDRARVESLLILDFSIISRELIEYFSKPESVNDFETPLVRI